MHQQDLVHQGLIDAGSFAKADCDAVKAKHGEVKHGEADSSEAEAVLGKELEPSDCEHRENMISEIPFFRNLCVLLSYRAPLRTSPSPESLYYYVLKIDRVPGSLYPLLGLLGVLRQELGAGSGELGTSTPLQGIAID